MTQPLSTDQTEPAEAGAELRATLAATPPTDHERMLRDAVRARAADILSRPVEDDSNFLDLGITSLKALELNRSLMTLTGLEVPLVAIIEYPTPAALAGHLAQALAQALADDGAAAPDGA